MPSYRPIKGSYEEYVDDAEAAAYAKAARSGLGDRWKLLPNEQLWVSYQPYLYQKGYELRPRYRPGWVRSWEGTNLNPRSREDSLVVASFKVMDAVRICDGKRVMIKAFDTRASPDELQILQYLGSNGVRADPRNHSGYAIDTFSFPERGSTWVFAIMNSYQSIDLAPFESVGDVVELVHQLLEGLDFMHQHNIAHRECVRSNVVVQAEALFASPPHPHPKFGHMTEDGKQVVSFTPRRKNEVKFYYIDYGVASMHPSRDVRGYATAQEGRNRELPEFMTPEVPYDPFKSDVFLVGHFLHQDFFLKESRTLSFLEPILSSMTAHNPYGRPTAAVALNHFKALRARLDPRVLSRPLHQNISRRVVYALLDCFGLFVFWFKRAVSRRR